MPTEYTTEQRIVAFWSKVDKSGGPDACWPWLGSGRKIGKTEAVWEGRTRHPAQNIAYLIAFGPYPSDAHIVRVCGNPICVNPSHLKPYVYSAEETFWQKVDRSGGDNACWLWTAGRNRNSYGNVRWNGTSDKAHRVAYRLAYGEIPDGLQVLHRCDNPPCCNPSHLFLGTNQDNMDDRNRKDRHAHGETSGAAKLTWAQVDEIRQRYHDGEKGLKTQLAREYGVTTPIIIRIVNGTGWIRSKHSEPEPHDLRHLKNP